jgi:Tfp pilus assembly protein PilF
MIVAYSTMVRPGGGDTPPASAPAYEPLPEARRALARARAAWLEGDALMADSLLGEARRLDPEYPAALAFEALQTTIYLHPDRRDPDPRPACELAEAFGPTAKQAAESALAADSTLVLPHVALGRVLWEAESSWAGGEAEFLRALELDPANPDANYWYGAFLLTAGRPEEAWAHFSRTIDENLSARRYVLPIGILAYKSGHLEEAEAVLRRAWILFNQEAWPATFLAANLRDQGRVEEAIEVLIEAGRDTVSEPLQGWQWAIAMGNGEAVDRHIAEAAAAGEYAMAATIAYRAGWDDVALQYLEAGWPGEVECPSIGRTWLLADFPRLADRPRFQEMMDVAGIPWRDSPLVGQLAEAEDG